MVLRLAVIDEDRRPLSALLSQALVACTVEADGLFAAAMAAEGQPTELSMAAWFNWLRFVPDAGVSLGELAASAGAPLDRATSLAGTFERWHLLELQPPAAVGGAGGGGAGGGGGPRRQGWGSGRGLGRGWRARPRARGRLARSVWAGIPAEVERRWRERFGAGTVDALRAELATIAGASELELPWGLPWTLLRNEPATLRRRDGGEGEPDERPLPALLAQALLVWALEFDGESPAPISLCANVLRVVPDAGVPVRELARLTGLSPEAADIGWQLKGLVSVGADPAGGKGRVVRPTPAGAAARAGYLTLSREIERSWEDRHGAGSTGRLREALEALFAPAGDGRPLITGGLVPPAGTARAGAVPPALGRGTVTDVAARRARQMAEQSAAFLADPGGALPHYPVWDHNRGFGP